MLIDYIFNYIFNFTLCLCMAIYLFNARKGILLRNKDKNIFSYLFKFYYIFVCLYVAVLVIYNFITIFLCILSIYPFCIENLPYIVILSVVIYFVSYFLSMRLYIYISSVILDTLRKFKKK